MFSSVKIKDVIKDLIDLAHLQSKVKQIKFEKKLAKQGFNCDTEEHFFEPKTRDVTDTSEKLFEEKLPQQQ